MVDRIRSGRGRQNIVYVPGELNIVDTAVQIHVLDAQGGIRREYHGLDRDDYFSDLE